MFDYNGKLLVHAICHAVLFFCHFIVMSFFLLNEINGDRDGFTIHNSMLAYVSVQYVSYTSSSLCLSLLSVLQCVVCG